jgi:hypothetical protein
MSATRANSTAALLHSESGGKELVVFAYLGFMLRIVVSFLLIQTAQENV